MVNSLNYRFMTQVNPAVSSSVAGGVGSFDFAALKNLNNFKVIAPGKMYQMYLCFRDGVFSSGGRDSPIPYAF